MIQTVLDLPDSIQCLILPYFPVSCSGAATCVCMIHNGPDVLAGAACRCMTTDFDMQSVLLTLKPQPGELKF